MAWIEKTTSHSLELTFGGVQKGALYEIATGPIELGLFYYLFLVSFTFPPIQTRKI